MVYAVRVSAWFSCEEIGWSLSVSQSPFSPFAKQAGSWVLHHHTGPDPRLPYTVFFLRSLELELNDANKLFSVGSEECGKPAAILREVNRESKQREWGLYAARVQMKDRWRVHSPRRNKEMERGERHPEEEGETPGLTTWLLWYFSFHLLDLMKPGVPPSLGV